MDRRRVSEAMKTPEAQEAVETEMQKFARASFLARDVVLHKLDPSTPLPPGIRKNPLKDKEAVDQALDRAFMQAGGLITDKHVHDGKIDLPIGAELSDEQMAKLAGQAAAALLARGTADAGA